MINNSEIVARIDTIREEKELTAAALAEKIGVQRSSFSHLISGRNKPSLDLLVRIHEVYPEYSLDWLVFGTTAPPPHNSNEKQHPLSFSQDSATPTDTAQGSEKSGLKVVGTILLFEDGSCMHYSSKS